MQTNKVRQMKRDKWQSWWDSLTPSTQEYLRNQPIWKHDELVGAVVAAFIVGLLIGLCF